VVNMKLYTRKKKGVTQILGLIGAVIVILVAVTIVPTIFDAIAQSQNNTNVTSAQGSMLDLAGLLFVVGIVVAGVAWAVGRGR